MAPRYGCVSAETQTGRPKPTEVTDYLKVLPSNDRERADKMRVPRRKEV